LLLTFDLFCHTELHDFEIQIYDMYRGVILTEILGLCLVGLSLRVYFTNVAFMLLIILFIYLFILFRMLLMILPSDITLLFLTLNDDNNNNQAFYSQASWGRLEMKPHEPKKQGQNKSEKEGA
jgi:hypothetical protein